MFALVAGVHGAFAVAGAGKEGAAGFLAEDVGIGQAELADGALDQRGEALGDRAEELMAGIDQFVAGKGVGERALLRLAEGGRQHQRGRGQRNEGG